MSLRFEIISLLQHMADDGDLVVHETYDDAGLAITEYADLIEEVIKCLGLTRED